MKLNKQEWSAIGLFVIVGVFVFFVFEQHMLSNFIDHVLEIPIDERHD